MKNSRVGLVYLLVGGVAALFGCAEQPYATVSIDELMKHPERYEGHNVQVTAHPNGFHDEKDFFLVTADNEQNLRVERKKKAHLKSVDYEEAKREIGRVMYDRSQPNKQIGIKGKFHFRQGTYHIDCWIDGDSVIIDGTAYPIFR